MAAKPEVLIPSLLQTEKLFQSWNEATKLAALQDIDRQRATPVSAQYPRRLATTGSGNNLAIAIVRNAKNRLRPMWATQSHTALIDMSAILIMRNRGCLHCDSLYSSDICRTIKAYICQHCHLRHFRNYLCTQCWLIYFQHVSCVSRRACSKQKSSSARVYTSLIFLCSGFASISAKNNFRTKWSGRVHPSPRCGDVLEHVSCV